MGFPFGSGEKIAARYMEAFAGMLEHTDAQIGRLIEYLRSIGELDNTVVVFYPTMERVQKVEH